MEYLYIDESGSMTNQHTKNNPYFVICIVRPKSPQKLKVLHKRFVRKYSEQLKAADKNGKMFEGDKFVELKGSSFTPELKKLFVDFFCRKETMEVYFIKVNNVNISNDLYRNTARAFNYVLKLALDYFIRRNDLPQDEYIIQLDERNERTNSRHFLQNYLNTELRMSRTLSSDINVQYFASQNNNIIQISDVLANLYFSQLRTNNYDQQIIKMQESGCLKRVFDFPPLY